jgi:hypothetical protein
VRRVVRRGVGVNRLVQVPSTEYSLCGYSLCGSCVTRIISGV